MRAQLGDSLDIQANPILFGEARHPHIVHIGSNPRTPSTLVVYQRHPDQTLTKELVTLESFLWLSDRCLLAGYEHLIARTERLTGQNFFQYLVWAHDPIRLRELSDRIAAMTGFGPQHPKSSQLLIHDPVTAYLVSSGRTYFNGLSIEDPKTLFLKIYPRVRQDRGLQSPSRSIEAIAVQCGFHAAPLILEGRTEKDQIDRLSRLIQEFDPDIICGHSLFKEDLDLLYERASSLRCRLAWGRQNEYLTRRQTRTQVAEKQLEYQRYTIAGRELCDLWLLAILHDVSTRDMEGFNFTDCANYFDHPSGSPQLPAQDRASVDLVTLSKLYHTLAYPYFLQAQIFPLSFESVMWRGNATRIDYLFLREYYRCRHSVSQKHEIPPFAGGLTTLEHHGCAYGVYHCDVASLYPSLILAHKLTPKTDELQVFYYALKDLRTFRLLAKEKFKHATTIASQNFFGGLQTTFKILINSFYGYLGFSQGHFADGAAAAEVTLQGRRLLTTMIEWLKAKEAIILEVDTDGIYFVPSKKLLASPWLKELNTHFPDEVRIEFDGRFRAMYCHKMKNYALLTDEGSLIMRGSGLRSRALEPYLRSFIEEMIHTALTQGPGHGETVLHQYCERLNQGLFDIQSLTKTETLIDNPALYAKKVEAGSRNRAAVYELALGIHPPPKAGEGLTYYITGNKATITAYDNCRLLEEFDPVKPDFNKKYYLKKLKDTYKKFAPLLQSSPLRAEIPYDELDSPPA